MRKRLLFLMMVMIPPTVQAAEIRFQPGDTIDVTVFNSPEMSGSFRICSDGFIRMPLAGKIPAAGKTEDELYHSILSAVSTFVITPHITVIPKFAVSVVGYVNRPGVFNVTGAEKVIEIVAQAGGFAPEASGRMDLHRDGKIYKISKNSILDESPALTLLQPGDVLVANRKMFTRNDYSVFISTLSAVSVLLYYGNNR